MMDRAFVNREYSADVDLRNLGGGYVNVKVAASGKYAAEVARVEACLNAPGRVWRISALGNVVETVVRYPEDRRPNKGGDENNPTITVAAVYFTTVRDENILLSLRMSTNPQRPWQPPASIVPISDGYPSGTSNLLFRQYPARQGMGVFLNRNKQRDLRVVEEGMTFIITTGNANFIRPIFVFAVASDARVTLTPQARAVSAAMSAAKIAEGETVGVAAFGKGVEIGGAANRQYYKFFAFDVADIVMARKDSIKMHFEETALPSASAAGAYAFFIDGDRGRVVEDLPRFCLNMWTGDASPWCCGTVLRYPSIRRYPATAGVAAGTTRWGRQIAPAVADVANCTAGANFTGLSGALRMPTDMRTEGYYLAPCLLCGDAATPFGGLAGASVVERFEYDFIVSEKRAAPFRIPVITIPPQGTATVDVVTTDVNKTPLYMHDGGTDVSVPGTMNFDWINVEINGKRFGIQRWSPTNKYDKTTTIGNPTTAAVTVVLSICSASVVPFSNLARLNGAAGVTVGGCYHASLRFLQADRCVDLPLCKIGEIREYSETPAASWSESFDNAAGLVRGWRGRSPAIEAAYADVVATAEVNSIVPISYAPSVTFEDMAIIRSLVITPDPGGFVVEVEIIEAEVQ